MPPATTTTTTAVMATTTAVMPPLAATTVVATIVTSTAAVGPNVVLLQRQRIAMRCRCGADWGRHRRMFTAARERKRRATKSEDETTLRSFHDTVLGGHAGRPTAE